MEKRQILQQHAEEALVSLGVGVAVVEAHRAVQLLVSSRRELLVTAQHSAMVDFAA
jgi:hypothetical protein